MTRLQEVSEWLDGPNLYAWISERRMLSEAGPNLERAVRRWKEGGTANVYTVDRVLTALDLHIAELPDEFWLNEKSRANGAKLTVESKAELLARLEAGESTRTLAREFGISRDTVVYHRRRMYGQIGASQHKRTKAAAA
jgi:DNA-binding CsgD family transcriptional regulator